MAVVGTTTAFRLSSGARQLAVMGGRTIAYREYGNAGPLVLLIHGVGSNGDCWQGVAPMLAAGGVHVVSVDLPGHGQSSKDRGDYSLGSMASAIRDLLDHLGHSKAVVVGHSLGGGIAMQFLYQYPQYVAGLVLVSSGGLGDETRRWLRMISLPGASAVLAGVAHPATLSAVKWLGRRLRSVGVKSEVLSADALDVVGELFTERDARQAFLSTLRSVVDAKGQKVSALGHLPKAAEMPVLLIWGDLDPTIPLSHGEGAAALLPNGRLVVFEGAGHEPHASDPERFVELILGYAAARQAAVGAL